MSYLATVEKTRYIDDYVRGRIPTWSETNVDEPIKAMTMSELVEKIKEYTGGLDLQFVEGNLITSGTHVDMFVEKATLEDIEEWKKGNIDLYWLDYYFRIYISAIPEEIDYLCDYDY